MPMPDLSGLQSIGQLGGAASSGPAVMSGRNGGGMNYTPPPNNTPLYVGIAAVTIILLFK